MNPFSQQLLPSLLLTSMCFLMHCKSRASSQLQEGNSADDDKLIVVTDTEGMDDALRARIDDGSLVLKKNAVGTESLSFPDGDLSSHFLFAGDLAARGAKGIWLRELFLDFNKRFPDRTHFLTGNHDSGRLGILRDLDRHEKKKDLRTIANLKISVDQNMDADSKWLADYVVGWFAEYGLTAALKFHQEELTAMHSRPISLEIAALDYYAQIRPGGRQFEYLKRCQDVFTFGQVIAVHGGLTEENFGLVGGRPERILDVRKWEVAMKERQNQDLETIENIFKGNGKITDIRGLYTLVYGDGKWVLNPRAQNGEVKNGEPVGYYSSRNESVIYPFRPTESGNFRIWPESVIKELIRQGYSTALVGHSPVAVPTLLSVPGFRLLMADVSFNEPRLIRQTRVDLSRGGAVAYESETSGGQKVFYDSRIASHASDLAGRIIGGYLFSGFTKDGKTAGWRFENGFKVNHVVFSSAELESFRKEGGIIDPTVDVSEQAKIYADKLVQNIRGIGGQIYDFNPIVGAKSAVSNSLEARVRELGGKPIWLAGYYKTSFRELSEEKKAELESVIENIVESAAKNGEFFITGGTTSGVEGLLHRKIREYNERSRGVKVSVIAAIHSLKNFGEIDQSVKEFTMISRDYGSAVKTIAPFLKGFDGTAVFLGESARFEEQLDAAVRNDVRRRYWDVSFEEDSAVASVLKGLNRNPSSEKNFVLKSDRHPQSAANQKKKIVIALDIDETFGIGADVKFKNHREVQRVEYTSGEKAYNKYAGRVQLEAEGVPQLPGDIHFDLHENNRMTGYFLPQPGFDKVLQTIEKLRETYEVDLLVTSINDPARVKAIVEQVKIGGRTLSDYGARSVDRDHFAVRLKTFAAPTKSFVRLREFLGLEETVPIIAIDDRAHEMVDGGNFDLALTVEKFTPVKGFEYLSGTLSGGWTSKAFSVFDRLSTSLFQIASGDFTGVMQDDCTRVTRFLSESSSVGGPDFDG